MYIFLKNIIIKYHQIISIICQIYCGVVSFMEISMMLMVPDAYI